MLIYRNDTQWFSSDETSHAVKRVEDVRALRARQFPEDQVQYFIHTSVLHYLLGPPPTIIIS